MARVILIGITVILTLYAVIECAMTPKDSMPGKLSKILWLLLIMLFMPMGGLAWIVLLRIDRAENGQQAPKPTDIAREIATRTTQSRQQDPPEAPPLGPDDDPEYLARIERELTRRRLAKERELRKQAERSGTSHENQTDPSSQPGTGKGNPPQQGDSSEDDTSDLGQ